MSLSKTLIFCLVLVQPRKTFPDMTEKLTGMLRIKTNVCWLAYIQVHFRLDFFMEANTMDPDQTAPDLGPYCVQYMLPKNISR